MNGEIIVYPLKGIVCIIYPRIVVNIRFDLKMRMVNVYEC